MNEWISLFRTRVHYNSMKKKKKKISFSACVCPDQGMSVTLMHQPPGVLYSVYCGTVVRSVCEHSEGAGGVDWELHLTSRNRGGDHAHVTAHGDRWVGGREGRKGDEGRGVGMEGGGGEGGVDWKLHLTSHNHAHVTAHRDRWVYGKGKGEGGEGRRREWRWEVEGRWLDGWQNGFITENSLTCFLYPYIWCHHNYVTDLVSESGSWLLWPSVAHKPYVALPSPPVCPPSLPSPLSPPSLPSPPSSRSPASLKIPPRPSEAESILLNVAGRLLMFQRDRCSVQQPAKARDKEKPVRGMAAWGTIK